MAKLIYIENEGAIFRGPSVSFPKEVWSVQDRKWTPYTGETPKRQGWGDEVSEAEAHKVMGLSEPGKLAAE